MLLSHFFFLPAHVNLIRKSFFEYSNNWAKIVRTNRNLKKKVLWTGTSKRCVNAKVTPIYWSTEPFNYFAFFWSNHPSFIDAASKLSNFSSMGAIFIKWFAHYYKYWTPLKNFIQFTLTFAYTEKNSSFGSPMDIVKVRGFYLRTSDPALFAFLHSNFVLILSARSISYRDPTLSAASFEALRSYFYRWSSA